MKTLGIIGITIAIIGLAVGIYCQIEVMSTYNYLANKADISQLERTMMYEYSDLKFILGSVALFLGPLGLILGLIAGIKKHKIGWVAVGVGLISFILGAIQSTHMFS